MSDSYLILKTLHVIGAVVLLGNAVVTGFWKAMADRTGDIRVIRFAVRLVALTDILFTLVGAALVFSSGLINAMLHGMDFLEIRWMRWGLGLLAASGAIWGAVLIPLQIRLTKIVQSVSDTGPVPADYDRLSRTWAAFGTLSTLLLLAALVFMVVKPV